MKLRLHLLAFVAFLCVAIQIPSQPISAQDVLAQAQPDADQVPASRAAGDQRSSGLYIVRMSDLPVVSYSGGVAGQAATKPGRGQKIDPNAPNVSSYVGYLDAQHDRAANAVGSRKVHDYRYTFNGFSAQL